MSACQLCGREASAACRAAVPPWPPEGADEAAHWKWVAAVHRAQARGEPAPPYPLTTAEREIDRAILQLRMRFPRDPFWVELDHLQPSRYLA